MQAPHPVQAVLSTLMEPTDPPCRSNFSASSSQVSVQLRQATPLRSKQAVLISAVSAQGRSEVSAKTSSSQASAQAPQNVQAPMLKSSTGVPAGPPVSMASGQAPMQSPQEWHLSLIVVSSVHGGRWTSRRHPRCRSASGMITAMRWIWLNVPGRQLMQTGQRGWGGAQWVCWAAIAGVLHGQMGILSREITYEHEIMPVTSTCAPFPFLMTYRAPEWLSLIQIKSQGRSRSIGRGNRSSSETIKCPRFPQESPTAIE